MYTPRLCEVCRKPLPEQRRGRPAQAHAGDCRRLLHNRRSWRARIDRFRVAHRPPAWDRSDVLPWAPVWDDDVLLEDAGYFLVPRNPILDLEGDDLRAAVNAWEERDRLLRRIRAELRRGGYDGSLLPEEHAELVRRKAERDARPRTLLQRLLES